MTQVGDNFDFPESDAGLFKEAVRGRMRELGAKPLEIVHCLAIEDVLAAFVEEAMTTMSVEKRERFRKRLREMAEK